MIRIFAFDDSIERLQSLKALISLSDDLEYVGEAENCENILEKMEKYFQIIKISKLNIWKMNISNFLKISKMKKLSLYLKIIVLYKSRTNMTAFIITDMTILIYIKNLKT